MKRASLVLYCVFIISCQRGSLSKENFNALLGGTRDDLAAAMVASPDGGFVLVGSTQSGNGDLTGNRGDKDVWIVKLDSKCKMLWQKNFGGSSNDAASAIISLRDGYIVGGTTSSGDGDVKGYLAGNSADFWLLKISLAGELVWQIVYGGKGDEQITCLTQTIHGDLFAAGKTTSTDGSFSGNKGALDALVLKFNAYGMVKSQYLFGGDGVDIPASIVATAGGGFALAGCSSSSNLTNQYVQVRHYGSQDFWLLKSDDNGANVSQYQFGGSKSDSIHSLCPTTDGGFIMAGSTFSNDFNLGGFNYDTSGRTEDLCILKIDANGKLAWIKTAGGMQNDKAKIVIATSDGGFLVGGQTSSKDGDVTVTRGQYDAWVIKYNQSGNLVWQQSSGGTGIDVASALLEFPIGRYVMAGSTNSNDGDFPAGRGGYDVLITTFKSNY